MKVLILGECVLECQDVLHFSTRGSIALERIAKMSLIRIHVCSVTSRSLADPAGPVKINRSNKFSQILRFNFVEAAILLMSSEVPFLSTPSCQACHPRPVFVLMDLVRMIA